MSEFKTPVPCLECAHVEACFNSLKCNSFLKWFEELYNSRLAEREQAIKKAAQFMELRKSGKDECPCNRCNDGQDGGIDC